VVRLVARVSGLKLKLGVKGTKIEQFIAYFNETMAKPFRWTMEAKPLTG
jgi:hypothetical protein